ncbi:MAG: hypothetical protein MSD82_02165 [Prevotella sp.]|nr:hypothetical protein [Prevotella sp.]
MKSSQRRDDADGGGCDRRCTRVICPMPVGLPAGRTCGRAPCGCLMTAPHASVTRSVSRSQLRLFIKD